MHGNQVVYWRKTSQRNENISVFVLEQLDGDNTQVRFKFNREIKSGDLRYLHETLLCPLLGRRPGYNQLEKGLCVMVDGPNHADTKDTFDGKAHYLCTSGGHPMPSNEADYSMEFVALGGWEKTPLQSCLEVVLLSRLSDDQFDYVYHLAGGRVRDAIRVSETKKRRRFLQPALPSVYNPTNSRAEDRHTPSDNDRWNSCSRAARDYRRSHILHVAVCFPFQPPVLSAFEEVQGGVTYHIHSIYIDVASASSIDTTSRKAFPFLD